MVSDKIREIRKSRGLSLRKLAKLAEMSNGNLSDIENNKVNPSTVTLDRLATALQVKTGEFFIENVYDEKLIDDNNKKDESINEDEEIDLFTTRLVKELLDADMIKDVEHIPPEITDMLLKALVLDYKKKKDAKN